MGHPHIKTPNEDRIAREGAKFTNMFVVNSLCSPSRACLLTGRYNHANHQVDNQHDIDETEIRNAYPALLQKAGYETAYIGKFHMGNNPQPHPGFDHWAVLPDQGVYIDPQLNVNGEMKKFTGHSGIISTDLALDWLKKPRQKPFCMVLGYKEPHGPRVPPEKYAHMYEDVKITPPVVTPDQLRGKPKDVRNRKPVNPEHFADDTRKYWQCCSAADEQIGRILQYLDQANLTENTLVAFAGDNGYFFGEFNLGDKRYAYDVSLRIPMLVRYPRVVKPGTVIKQDALNIDFCPTLLDLAGVPIPKRVQGMSWKPLFENRPVKWRSSFMCEYFREGKYPVPTIKGIRTSHYKYLEYPEGDTPELYDLQADPNEWNNLSDKPESKALMERLRTEMLAIEKETT
jgi:N-acetylglucosamine-6-sulfatase